MAYIVKMPKLGFEMQSGEIVDWKLDEGDQVQEGDVVAEIEVEKSAADIESRESGVLRSILLEEGEEGPPGVPVAIVAGADQDISDLEIEAKQAFDEKMADFDPE